MLRETIKLMQSVWALVEHAAAWAATRARILHGIAPQHAASLFDNLVGGPEQVLRHLNPERFRSRYVDHKLKLRGSLDGQISGFLSFEYPTDVEAYQSIYVR